MQIARGEPAPPDAELLNIVRMAMFELQTTNWSSGALSALLASGKIELIKDRTIRNRLAEWPSRLEEAFEDERMANRYYERTVWPYTTEYLPAMWLFVNREEVISGSRGAALSELRSGLSGDRIVSVLGFYSFIHGVTGSELRRLRARLADLVSTMGHEQEGVGS